MISNFFDALGAIIFIAFGFAFNIAMMCMPILLCLWIMDLFGWISVF